MPSPLSLRDLNRALLARQLLLRRERFSVNEAIERLVGLQAQEAAPPFVALWSRLEKFEREDLGDRLHRRAVVRVTAMRGTLHLMTAADFVALRPALQPALTAGMRSVLRKRAEDLDIGSLVAIARRYFGERPRSFSAFRDHLAERFPEGDHRAMAFAVRTHLPLVQVPTDAKWSFPASPDFTVAASWLDTSIEPGPSFPSTEVAGEGRPSPRSLVRRYLAAFGPATPADAQTWSALRGLRETFEELRPELETFRDESGRELFDLPDAPRPRAAAPAPVRYVAAYDNLVLAHADRSRIVAEEHRKAIVTRNLRVHPTFLVGGFVAGTWKVVRRRALARLDVQPFASLSKRVCEELVAEGERLLSFLEDETATREVVIRSP